MDFVTLLIHESEGDLFRNFSFGRGVERSRAGLPNQAEKAPVTEAQGLAVFSGRIWTGEQGAVPGLEI